MRVYFEPNGMKRLEANESKACNCYASFIALALGWVIFGAAHGYF